MCIAAANDVRPSTAAIYYIYAPDEHSLKPMLAKVVNKHRQYESVYQQLGFKKVAEWARCEKALA